MAYIDDDVDRFFEAHSDHVRRAALDESIPPGAHFPAAYRAFLQAYSLHELDVPWVTFPSTMTPDPLDELRLLHADFPGERLLPVAYEEDRSGVFCLDCREAGDEPAVLLWRLGFDDPDRAIVESVFSSFRSLLRVLTEVLEAPGGLCVEDESTQERADTADRLRSIDPEGFGGPGWERWWERRILAGRPVLGLE